MARTDYFDDPQAPEPNSIVPAVSVIARDESGRVLLIHRTDNDLWSIPGGAMEPGESVRQAAVRETREETGYDVDVTGLVGVYTDPRHVIAYSDGEVRSQFSICVTATVTGGQARTSSESSEVVWQPVGQLDELAIHPTNRLRIDHALDPGRIQPWLT
ncbi:NUDIX hydrolase [Myceligenerans pegani]|uniref:NUDIX domain-containing protein n=1 Tax=Myceligenerans pegani TaxID=2776917 RepID=A0ABR9N0L1_9MICO|nr:NUDIX domain-containing protein [Myceligenerans sp. TRM 65318]MBE1876608.1 NUDIX domain-containing protein [Myceligenerans sp. TRM 65318]MBE3018879.1 NUDIX domain-containing protein [Myceligenerans sp. TRM 65318]